jgi:hypothetical protein
MPTPKDTLKERLARYRQIKISVIGRKSGCSAKLLAKEGIYHTLQTNEFGPLLHREGGLP